MRREFTGLGTGDGGGLTSLRSPPPLLEQPARSICRFHDGWPRSFFAPQFLCPAVSSIYFLHVVRLLGTMQFLPGTDPTRASTSPPLFLRADHNRTQRLENADRRQLTPSF